MSYLKFSKTELVNLEYSLKREILFANRAGGYCNTTPVCCNTRKYHGLLVVPIDKFEGKKHILLSAVDETLIQHDKEFNLGIRCYGDVYEPRGHKYIRDFELSKDCTITYNVGGMIFSKSLLFLKEENQLLIKYTLLEAHSPTTLRLKPFLAYRDIHSLTMANDVANTGFTHIDNGAKYNMYNGFPDLNIQLSKNADYYHLPGWYKGVVYNEEKRRGFESKEDQFVPGYFEMPIAKGESIILSASLKSVSSKGLKHLFETKYEQADSMDDYDSCTRLAAKQFIINNNGETEIALGYTWLGKGLRETFIALPGLTLFNDGNEAAFDAVLKSAYKIYERQLLNGSKQVEASLWLFWVAQQYSLYIGDEEKGWKKFRTILKKIADSFVSGERMGVLLKKNGLLWAKMNRVALTWMNAYDYNGDPITERAGYQVETNALWYNALAYLVDMETKYGKVTKNVKVWDDIKRSIEENFLPMFWMEEKKHLADYIDSEGPSGFTRPNQLLACIFNYSPISEEVKALIVNCVKKELLTVRGIRTLSPKNPLYKGVYEGNQHQRDMAYHQGSTRTWLLGFYIEASLKLYGHSFVRKAEELIAAFEEDITIHGIGSIPELYDGDPPHNPHGAISHAVATAELIRAKFLISNTKEEV